VIKYALAAAVTALISSSTFADVQEGDQVLIMVVGGTVGCQDPGELGSFFANRLQTNLQSGNCAVFSRNSVWHVEERDGGLTCIRAVGKVDDPCFWVVTAGIEKAVYNAAGMPWSK
jgi:hypothetical protein